MFKDKKYAKSCCLLGGGGFPKDPDAMDRIKKVLMELITDYGVRDFWLSYHCKMGIYAYSFIKSLPTSLGPFRTHLVVMERFYEDAVRAYGEEDIFDSIEAVTGARDTLFGDFELELEYMLEHAGHLVYYRGVFDPTGENLLKSLPKKGSMSITYLGCTQDALDHMEQEYRRKLMGMQEITEEPEIMDDYKK